MQYKNTHEDLIIKDITNQSESPLEVKEVIYDYSGEKCVAFKINQEDVWVSQKDIPNLIEKLTRVIQN